MRWAGPAGTHALTHTQVHSRTHGHCTQFIARFEEPGKPCVIRGTFDGCRAWKKWTLKALARKYGDVKFKVGEDDDGYKVMVKLK